MVMDFNNLLVLGTEFGDLVVGFGSAVIAVISALVARNETRKQRKLQTERLRQHIDSASLDWGNAAIDTLARCAMFARTRHMQQNEAAFQASRTNMLITLSTLVDRGRMFFPNYDPDLKGVEKEGAYRGHRPPILDAMMWAYHEIEALTREGGPSSEDCAGFIDECRRLLVSELQAHLDPRRKDEIVERFDDRASDSRKGAIDKAEALKQKLQSRRPDFQFGEVAAASTRLQ
jgi:hypothetical protein